MNYTDIDYIFSYLLLGFVMGLLGFLVGLYSNVVAKVFEVVSNYLKNRKNGTAGKKE